MKTVVITGASSGISFGLAKALLRQRPADIRKRSQRPGRTRKPSRLWRRLFDDLQLRCECAHAFVWPQMSRAIVPCGVGAGHKIEGGVDGVDRESPLLKRRL
jgi:NAD(P)-dependent dehydrogenase (short-subunit alcohol dehydrogenase family)